MRVTVYLNEARGSFFGFNVDDYAALRQAAQFELDPELTAGADPMLILNHVYEQLNVGGDMVPATEWTTRYRAERNRSLSVGDVVVIGETAWAVDHIGFATITTEALAAGIARFAKAMSNVLDEIDNQRGTE